MDRWIFQGLIGIAVLLAVAGTGGPATMAQAPPPPVVEIPPDILAKILSSVSGLFNNVGPSTQSMVPPARFLETSPSQQAALSAVGIDLIHVLSWEKQLPFTDRALPPGYGILNVAAYAGRVVNPTSERVTRAYSVLTSVLKGRGINVRETPVTGVGMQAVGFSGNATHSNGQMLDYQAVSAMITRGILFGGEAKGEPGARRQLIVMMTTQISNFIDTQTW